MRQTFLVGASLCVILLDFRWKTKKIKTHFNVGGVIPIFMILILLDKIWVQYTYELDPIQYKHIISLEKCLDCIKSDTHTPIYIYIYIYICMCVYILKKRRRKKVQCTYHLSHENRIYSGAFFFDLCCSMFCHIQIPWQVQQRRTNESSESTRVRQRFEENPPSAGP